MSPDPSSSTPPSTPPSPPPSGSSPPASQTARETYSHGHHASVLAAHGRRTAASSAAYLLDHLKSTDVLLDVGTGPGTITVDLAGRVARVVGIDSAETAVAATAALARERGVANVEVALGDVYALDAPDDTYDVTHAHQVLQHVADPVAALAEMRRVTRPGGIVAVRDADYARMTWHPSDPGLDRWLELYESLARRNGGEPDAGRRLRSWALAAGLEDLTVSASVWCYADAESVGWWTQSWSERMTESSFATSALRHSLSDEAELTSLADAWRTWGAHPDACFWVVHGEVIARV